jgi:hypothetical protein
MMRKRSDDDARQPDDDAQHPDRVSASCSGKEAGRLAGSHWTGAEASP